MYVFNEDHILLKVLLLSLVHILAPLIRSRSSKFARQVNSFGGGLAATYVFIQLIPELDRGHHTLGDHIYFVVLLGFLLYYGIEKKVSEIKKRHPDHHGSFSMSMSTYFLYNWLIVYGLPEETVETISHLVFITLALGFHLLYSDIRFLDEYGSRYKNIGKYIAVSGLIMGWFFRQWVPIESEVVADLLTAFLAGSVIYTVFRSELPDHKQTSFRWFLLGVLVYSAVLLVLRSLE